MERKTLSYTIDQAGIAILTLSRPERLNAMSAPMFQALSKQMDVINSAKDVKAVLLTGEGRAFCTGLDLGEMKGGYGGKEAFYRHVELANKLIVQLSELNKPLVAAVNGVAAGSGMNIVLAADLAVASSEASFSQSFDHVGLIPDVGGAYMLPRIVGVSKAKEMIFAGRKLDAWEALKLGIVHKLAEPEQVLETAYALAKRMASGPAFAFAVAKKMLSRCNEMDIHTALHMEALSQALVSNSEDYKEGVEAFFEKRAPAFWGHTTGE